MARGATIRYYLAGSIEPFHTSNSADGLSFSTEFDLPDGTYQVEVTAQRVGETESARTAPSTVIVGAATPPAITSPLDWDEIRLSDTVGVVVQAGAEETIRVFSNGHQLAEGTADGSGQLTVTATLHSAGLEGIDPIENLTACRVIGGNLSHPSPVVRVIPTYGRVAAKGATTLRLLNASSLLSFFRYRMGGEWDNETLAQGGSVFSYYRADYTETIVTSGFHGGVAPGYVDVDWLCKHTNRVNTPTSGKTATWLNYTSALGDAEGTPNWFDIAHHLVATYYRGYRGAYLDYKSKVIDILENAPRTASGLVRAYSIGGSHHMIGSYADTEQTARYALYLSYVRRIGVLEGDTTGVALYDQYLASFKGALASRFLANGTIDAAENDVSVGWVSCEGWAATVTAIVADALPAAEYDAALANLIARGNNSRFGGVLALENGINSYPSPFFAGTFRFVGRRYDGHAIDGGGHPYTYPYSAGVAAAAVARSSSDIALAEAVAEDVVKQHSAEFTHCTQKWIGVFPGVHQGAARNGTHPTGNNDICLISDSAWFSEKEDRYADLGPITSAGSANSVSADFDIAAGHRAVGVEVTALDAGGQPTVCTSATVQIIERLDIRSKTQSVGDTYSDPKGWKDSTIFTENILATVSISDSSNGSTLSGCTPKGCYAGGGKIRLKVVSATWPSTVGTFSATLKQSRIAPTFEADPQLGFADTFKTDRFSTDNTDYEILEGGKASCSVVLRNDVGAGNVEISPLTKTDFVSTSAAWVGLIQTQSNFADGAVMIDKIVRSDASLAPLTGTPSIDPVPAAYFRVSADKLTYIKVTPYEVTEVLNGTTVSTAALPGITDGETNWGMLYGRDEVSMLAVIEGTRLKMACWRGELPYTQGAYSSFGDYGTNPFSGGTVILSGQVSAAGRAGFGCYGPSFIGSARICGKQAQPVPPGFFLDTGLAVPPTERIVPQCHLAGETVVPASASSCLRNEWGARVTPVVNGYNARWSY